MLLDAHTYNYNPFLHYWRWRNCKTINILQKNSTRNSTAGVVQMEANLQEQLNILEIKNIYYLIFVFKVISHVCASCSVHFYASSNHFRDIHISNVWPSKSRKSRSRSPRAISRPMHFTLAPTILEIITSFLYLQKVGQGHSVQFSQLGHSMPNIKISKVDPCTSKSTKVVPCTFMLSLTISEILIFHILYLS